MTRRPVQGNIILAFAAIYLIWGSTFLAIRFALESFPPFLSAGLRFVAAGTLLYAWCQWRGIGRASWTQWGFALMTGSLLLVSGNGLVVLAERTAPSGLAALVIGLTPLWMTLLESAGRKQWPPARSWFGITLGLAGVAILTNPFHAVHLLSPANLALLVTASVSWSLGSFLSRNSKHGLSLFALSALQMLTAGLLLMILGLGAGESRLLHDLPLTVRAASAQLYLVLIGSIVGFSAYAWLLPRVSLTAISTYSLVNPVVAVGLGAMFADEPFTWRILAALLCIVAALVLLLRPAGGFSYQPDTKKGPD